ncbi:leukotriene B4 receptor 1-like [Ambystoma mexicanum]|uniref:leukotriene B4 receptor 1-like n=1 Tax=Ambystoma mexicanum TaxID=8296 RepID=UPI0037E8D8E1
MTHAMDPVNATVEYGASNVSDSDENWVGEVLIPSLFAGFCFLVGVPGNGLVIWTILCKIPQRSLTVVLLLNLAVADFIVLITLPLWIHSFSDKWVFGLFVCRFLTYIICFTMYASVFFLTVMSLQRFTAVFFPFASRSWQKKKTVYGIVLSVWVFSLGMAAPAYIFRSTSERNGTVLCNDWVYSSDQQELADLCTELVICFVVPFSIMTVCYALVIRRIRRLKFQGKSKSGKLIASVVIAFYVCWIPYHMLNVLLISAISLRSSSPIVARTLTEAAKAGENICDTLVFLSSCLNPILYAFAARSFQGGLRGTNFAKLFGQMNEDSAEGVGKNQHISSATTEL